MNRKNPSWITGAENYYGRICTDDRKTSEDVSAFPSVIAERMQRNIEAHEPQIHSRRVL